jgi:hypothetical protein
MGRPFPHSGCLISTRVCGYPLLEFSTKIHRHASKKNGNYQEDGGGQAYKTKSMAENISGNIEEVLQSNTSPKFTFIN